MTPAIKGVMLAISSSLAASIVAKVTVITALGLAAAWLARGNRAAVRHALLAVDVRRDVTASDRLYRHAAAPTSVYRSRWKAGPPHCLAITSTLPGPF